MKKKNKKKQDANEKLLKNILFVLAGIILIVFFYYFYAQSQINMNYKEIKFTAASYGTNLIMYETQTLLPPNDGTKGDFGFRIRTKPSALKKVNFEGADEFNLMKINAVNFRNESFICEGKTTIALANLKRLFEKTGSEFIVDENASCDEQGRYNLFIFKFGEKTQINKIGNNCYEVVVKGDNDSCEILPATEKIMVEVFLKYGEFVNN